MADRKRASADLAEKVGITPANLSRIKTGHIRAIRFSTLEALCEQLHCQPGDLMEYVTAEEYAEMFPGKA